LETGRRADEDGHEHGMWNGSGGFRTDAYVEGRGGGSSQGATSGARRGMPQSERTPAGRSARKKVSRTRWNEVREANEWAVPALQTTAIVCMWFMSEREVSRLRNPKWHGGMWTGFTEVGQGRVQQSMSRQRQNARHGVGRPSGGGARGGGVCKT
jgi:hypothetical protein